MPIGAIRLSNNGTAYWGKNKGGLGFSTTSLKTPINHVMWHIQAISIPMVIDSASFWANLFLYSYEEYMLSLISSDKIKARHFHSPKRFLMIFLL